MIIKLERHSTDFTQVVNETIRDKRLSFKARGLLIYLLSQVDGWRFNAKDAAKHSTDGRRAIYSAMKELKALGYAQLVKVRKGNRLCGSYVTIREIPKT